MTVYSNYFELVKSTLLDNIILSLGCTYKWASIMLILLGGPSASIVPLTSLWLRTYIHPIKFRRIWIWSTLGWTLWSGTWLWSVLLLGIELIREGLIWKLPRFLQGLEQNYQPDPVSETAFQRIYHLIRIVPQQPTQISFYQAFQILQGLQTGDGSNPFSSEQRDQFKKMFAQFSSTCFVTDENSLTMFFPSFALRISQPLQIVLTTSAKLVQPTEPSLFSFFSKDQVCAICQDGEGSVVVELKCGHRYCLNCIFNWLHQSYTCPLCRREVF